MQSRICDVFEKRPIRFHRFVPWFYSARKQLYASRCDARKMLNFSHEFDQANFCESYFKTKETEKKKRSRLLFRNPASVCHEEWAETCGDAR